MTPQFPTAALNRLHEPAPEPAATFVLMDPQRFDQEPAIGSRCRDSRDDRAGFIPDGQDNPGIERLNVLCRERAQQGILDKGAD